ncbi:hypothetical protein FACS1894206_07090 [Deltaproteobacteria bacterium]|nr:hypothetical protein FACS1894206_07090 [Deltaproteobacteria bacterium]
MIIDKYCSLLPLWLPLFSSGAGGVLAKMTMFVAIAFAVTSLGYNIATTERKVVKSVLPSVTLEEAAPLNDTQPGGQNAGEPAKP